jgi:hypothetical protein
MGRRGRGLGMVMIMGCREDLYIGWFGYDGGGFWIAEVWAVFPLNFFSHLRVFSCCVLVQLSYLWLRACWC